MIEDQAERGPAAVKHG
jgi:hypothetical protein